MAEIVPLLRLRLHLHIIHLGVILLPTYCRSILAPHLNMHPPPTSSYPSPFSSYTYVLLRSLFLREKGCRKCVYSCCMFHVIRARRAVFNFGLSSCSRYANVNSDSVLILSGKFVSCDDLREGSLALFPLLIQWGK